MHWTQSIKNKLVASIILLTLCVLVLLSNYLDRIHSENIKHSISTLYEDRLLVEEYILKMTHDVYKIREHIIENKHLNKNDNTITSLSKKFHVTYIDYSKTKLTDLEKLTLNKLDLNFKEFKEALDNEQTNLLQHTNVILNTLNTLSKIQLDESLVVMKQVDSQYAVIKTSSQFVFGIVILILIVLQILVFSGKANIPLFKNNSPSLN